MKRLILIRGIPGSGKSTLAESLRFAWNAFKDNLTKWGPAVHFENDMFFVGEDGIYRYNRDHMKDAWEWCQAHVEANMTHVIPSPLIIVSNTFTTFREMEPYYKMAKTHGYEIQIITVKRPVSIEQHFKDNVHSVPMKIIERMAERWED